MRTDNGRSVVVNIRIVGPDSCGLGERLVVAGNVSSLQPNEANEVMYCARFVIRDLQQERRNGLLKSCQVGIGRLSINWLEVI